ncbi:hypothetical protein DEM26_08950 [Thioclava sp. NG1]|uniref:hypothetical protein n=1 Tax=Thioclava sp. NG1 TaxID=2182426 RepID=UPI000D60A0C5|nr:hypothetical protein [Thioclava sp. NG1]PWE50068.1 hypothetical protein DEM26_08950 [Thioclava sp. NG1]
MTDTSENSADYADLRKQLENAPIKAEPDPEAKAKAEKKAAASNKKQTSDDGGDKTSSGRPRGAIWQDCPVRPLGVNGEMSYYLDRHGQLRAVKKHEAQVILHLFGDRIELLCQKFPQYDKEGSRKRDRFDQTSAAMTMISACSEKGLFNPDGAVRGVGAWKDDDGKLIYHCGQKLITDEGDKDPQDLDGKIYPAYPPIPAPEKPGAKTDPATKALKQFETWSWEWQDTTPMIALGMTGVLMLCGAMDWRPAYWLTGDKAYGKSAFQDLIKYLMGGDHGLVQSTDATKSGITSRLGHSSLPVALDELEPGDEGSGKERAIIELARVASSGGQWMRGSSDQKGASGNVYSAFLFSSILIPGSMKPQDRSRLITLHLRPLDAKATKLNLDPKAWKETGRQLKWTLISRWKTWPERLELWRAALAKAGLSGRNGDNYATTIAMADMALNEEMPSEDMRKGWAEKLAVFAQTETEEIGSDAEDMLQWLIGQPFDVFRRGELWNVAHWIMVAAQMPAAPQALVAGGEDVGGKIDNTIREEAAKRANEKLAKVGLRVRGKEADAALFIANARLPGLRKLFEKSHWANGEWAQSAKRVPGAQPVSSPLTLAGQRTRGVYVPLKSIGGFLSFPMDSAPTQSSAAAPPMSQEYEDGF